MGGTIIDRLSFKEHLKALQIELQEEYGLSPIAGRALTDRIGRFIDEPNDQGHLQRKPGQILYSAVAQGEPAGKPVKWCRLTAVKLTLFDPSDTHVLVEDGSVELRKIRLSRLATEAHNSGGLISQEDLAVLLGADISTIKRLSRELRRKGIAVPTRGLVSDIGSGISHKNRVIALYFKGWGSAQIAASIGHAGSSVERYLSDFARVVELAERGLDHAQISRITGLSSFLTRSYVSLYTTYNTDSYRFSLDELRRRFSPVSEEASR